MVSKTLEGHWVIAGDTHIGSWVVAQGRLDQDMGLCRFDEFLIPGSLVIDVGANIGTHTTYYLSHVGPDGHVIAYEPHKECFECLTLNCPNAQCYNYAVGKTHCLERMVENAYNVGASYVSRDPSLGSYDVQVVSLDEHVDLDYYSTIPFIKIDAEGCDLEVLMGSVKLLERFRPHLFMELNAEALSRRGHKPTDLKELLEALSYSPQFISKDDWNSPQGDILCYPI